MAERGGRATPLRGGTLYLVSTPIGNARDITLRALDVFAAADVLAAEDTRSARRLMEIHGIALGERPLLSYHDHNGPAVRPRILGHLAAGRSVAFASEAGTPMVADPGFTLARAAIAEGHRVEAVPGVSAALAALTVSGLPTDRFFFAGFPPAQSGARGRFLARLAGIDATIVLYESPRRLGGLLRDLGAAFGADRHAAVCRELTKRFEEVRRADLAALAKWAAAGPIKGECVLVIDRPAARGPADDGEVAAALEEALKTQRLKDAAKDVADRLGRPKREVYQIGLRLGDARGGPSDDA